MRARGEEEKVTAFSCGEYTARKCRNTILKEEGVVDRVSDWPQGAGLRELKAEYSPPLIPATFSSCSFSLETSVTPAKRVVKLFGVQD
jgi:hypothetical protein